MRILDTGNSLNKSSKSFENNMLTTSDRDRDSACKSGKLCLFVKIDLAH